MYGVPPISLGMDSNSHRIRFAIENEHHLICDHCILSIRSQGLFNNLTTLLAAIVLYLTSKPGCRRSYVKFLFPNRYVRQYMATTGAPLRIAAFWFKKI